MEDHFFRQVSSVGKRMNLYSTVREDTNTPSTEPCIDNTSGHQRRCWNSLVALVVMHDGLFSNIVPPPPPHPTRRWLAAPARRIRPTLEASATKVLPSCWRYHASASDHEQFCSLHDRSFTSTQTHSAKHLTCCAGPCGRRHAQMPAWCSLVVHRDLGSSQVQLAHLSRRFCSSKRAWQHGAFAGFGYRLGMRRRLCMAGSQPHTHGNYCGLPAPAAMHISCPVARTSAGRRPQANCAPGHAHASPNTPSRPPMSHLSPYATYKGCEACMDPALPTHEACRRHS